MRHLKLFSIGVCLFSSLCLGQNPPQRKVGVGSVLGSTVSHEKQQDPNVLKVCASQAQAIRIMLEGSMKEKGLNEAVEAQVVEAKGSRSGNNRTDVTCKIGVSTLTSNWIRVEDRTK